MSEAIDIDVHVENEIEDETEDESDDVVWPDLSDTSDMPIGEQYAESLAALMAQADEATARIEQIYRDGIRAIRELTVPGGQR